LLRARIAAVGAAIAVVLGVGTWFVMNRASAQLGHQAPASHHLAARIRHVVPLRVVSVSPAAHARHADGASPIRVVFSAALAADSPMPSVRPAIPGHWKRVSATTVEYLPRRGFLPRTRVRVKIPAGPSGMRSASGGQLAIPVSVSYRTGTFKVLRLEQLLAQLGYLPVTWAPAPGSSPVPRASRRAQLSAAYRPPAGTFTWQAGYPAELTGFWRPGHLNEIVTGAVMAFEADHGLAMDGVAGPEVWSVLLRAAEKGEDNTHGYTYALARETSPETLTVWHDGKVILHTLANTGIPAAPTTIGTSPVYLRYQNQIMRGTNPDGTKYADPVAWVAYFRAGEAIHYFPRASYGWPQSLGCVELPWTQAKDVWPYLTYGTLVTVAAH
jgi:peptidoglycan hydrolase-like protein with peptidoglycan-binding domain